MVELWFTLLCFMLTMFVVLDGWNLGVGAVHLAVAKTQVERRQVIAALGPLWSWHEVWLVAAAGTFLLAFPKILASAFSGFYLALWLVIWTFVLRGVSIEVGGHINDRLWQSAWDAVFAASSLLLAALFGAALGNVIRGVPVGETGKFSMSLFTNFGVRGRVGIFDWYTLSIAMFTTSLLAAHGATYLTRKTEGKVHERSERLARRLWVVALCLFAIISLQTWIVRPGLYRALVQRPFAWLATIAIGTGVWAIWTGLLVQGERRAFLGSCTVIAGLLAATAVGVFPVMLHSTLAPEYSLTVYNSATAERGLMVALIWWPVALVLALTYFVVIMPNYSGKVRASEDTRGSY
jgi:cytochrome d ubiquinol oxidase subunit II